MDALKILIEDHRSFGALFKRYQSAQTPRLKEDLARRLLQEAKLHITLEEKYVYPIAKERSGSQLDDHVQVKSTLEDLEQRPPHEKGFEERLAAFVTELIAHSEEEERAFFPALRRTMRRGELEALGRLIQNAREARPEAPPADGLMVRAVSHLVTSWKAQLGDTCARMLSAALSHSPRTTHP